MTKEEIRNRVVEMASGSKGIIVSIPEALAMVGGEMYAYRLLHVAKVRVPQNENPMRCTSVLGGEIIAFTYADAQRLRKYKFKCVKSKEILIMHTFLCAGKKET